MTPHESSDPSIGTGIYTPLDAQRLLGVIDQTTLSATVAGRWMQRRRRRSLLTFEDFISLRVVAALLSYGMTLGPVLAAEGYLAKRLDAAAPFATERFALWGADIVFPEAGGIESAIHEGQRAFPELQGVGRYVPADRLRNAAARLDDVSFSAGRPERLNWRQHVALEPDVQFGEPCILGTRITVATIGALAARGLGEEEIAAEYGVDVASIAEALAFQEQLAA
jgi:uncharacterized protein (DUF433 family)